MTAGAGPARPTEPAGAADGSDAAGGSGATGPTDGSDRAVSEVVGFVLAFAVVVAGVAVVYTTGFGVLTEIRDGEQVDSAEVAVESLARTFENLQRGDPARSSEFRLNGGRVAVTDGTTVDVAVTADGSVSTSRSFDAGALVYRLDGHRIRYEAGAVFRGDESGNATVHSPPLLCNDDRAVVSVVSLRADDSASLAGDTSAVVVARTRTNELRYPTGDASARDASAVDVTVSSPAGGAWSRLFERRAGWKPNPSGSGYTCEADAVYVRHTVVDVDVR